MKDIYTKLTEMHEKGRFSVLATIIKQAGPSPRGIGTKCLILDDGSFEGTIGGGVLEAQTLQEARKVFKTGLPIRLEFSLKGADVSGTDMLCGGDVEVFLEPITPISFFTIHKELFIHPPHLLYCFTPSQHKTPPNHVHLTHVIPTPPGHPFAAKESATGK